MQYNNLRSIQACLQFIKFRSVGFFNTVLALLLYYCVVFLGGHYMLANTVGWIVSVMNAYYWNDKYVFKNNTQTSHTRNGIDP